MDNRRSQTPWDPERTCKGDRIQYGDGAANAVSDTSTPHTDTALTNDAIFMRPLFTRRASKITKTARTENITHRGGIVSTVPSHRGRSVSTLHLGSAATIVPSHKIQSMLGRKVAKKPATMLSSGSTNLIGSAHTHNRTQIAHDSRNDTIEVISVVGKVDACIPEQTPPVEHPTDSALDAGWTLYERSKGGKLKQGVPGSIGNFKRSTHKNKKQRRKARQKAAVQQGGTTVPVSRQPLSDSKDKLMQTSADVPVVGRAPLKRKLDTEKAGINPEIQVSAKRLRRKARQKVVAQQEGTTVAVSRQPLSASKKDSVLTAASVPVESCAPLKRKRDSDEADDNPEVQVSVKRFRSNETITPTGEPERQKLESTEATSKMAYAEAIKAGLLVTVTTVNSGHINAQQSEEVQQYLQALLMQEACQPGNSQSSGPLFRGKPITSNGVLRLWCEDHATLTWLKRSVATITLSSGEKLVVKSHSEVTRRIHCGILFPGVWEDFHTVARALRYQNPWAEIDRWAIHRVAKQGTETFVVVSIPEEVVQSLMEHERRLGFMLGSVYVKFQGPRGKYVEYPPGNIVYHNKIIEPEPSNALVAETLANDVATIPESQTLEQVELASEKYEEEDSDSEEERTGELATGEGDKMSPVERNKMSPVEGESENGMSFSQM